MGVLVTSAIGVDFHPYCGKKYSTGYGGLMASLAKYVESTAEGKMDVVCSEAQWRFVGGEGRGEEWV
jgi:hypothetical protein